MATTREEQIRELVTGGLDERAAQVLAAGRGVQVAPAIPASTVDEVNPFDFPVVVYVTGGTVTVIAVNGTVTGLTSGTFRVPVGGKITLTYSVAPTWKWIAD